MAKAWPANGRRIAETNGLGGQTAKQALREVPNRHCKPQCDRVASLPAMPRRDGEQRSQSPVSTLLPPLHAGGSVT
jgi:hypothetical protein